MMEMRLNYKYSYVKKKKRLEFGIIVKYGQLVILVIIINESKIICNIYNIKLKHIDI